MALRTLTISAFLLLVARPSLADITPGGLASGHAYASGMTTATQMSSTIEINTDPGVVSYFWAQQFFLNTVVDHSGYFGIQGNGITNGITVGKMFIFSIWNADGATPAAGAVAQSFGGEGVGYSIHRTYDWQPNVAYTFHLTRENATGWHATIHASTNEDIDLGTIDIPETTTIQTGFANFTEYYGSLPSCAALPAVQVTFSNLLYDTTPVPFNDTSPYGICAPYAASSLPTVDSNRHTIPNPDLVFLNGFD